jgi:hypothetical protein
MATGRGTGGVVDQEQTKSSTLQGFNDSLLCLQTNGEARSAS